RAACAVFGPTGSGWLHSAGDPVRAIVDAPWSLAGGSRAQSSARLPFLYCRTGLSYTHEVATDAEVGGHTAGALPVHRRSAGARGRALARLAGALQRHDAGGVSRTLGARGSRVLRCARIERDRGGTGRWRALAAGAWAGAASAGAAAAGQQAHHALERCACGR